MSQHPHAEQGTSPTSSDWLQIPCARCRIEQFVRPSEMVHFTARDVICLTCSTAHLRPGGAR